MTADRRPLHVTLVGTPDTQVAPLAGLFETLNAFPLLASLEPDVPSRPFAVEIVAPGSGGTRGASGLPLGAHRTPGEVPHTDIAIVPLMMVADLEWVPGRYPRLVEWLRRQHAQGAVLASACTGALLLAETGLLDGGPATLHWAFAPTFHRHFPAVRLRTAEALVTAGPRDEFVMTGGVMSWHDLALHLIARHVGPAAARAMARLLMLEWHGAGQAPYAGFAAVRNHGDGLVAEAERWLAANRAVANPVDAVVANAGVARRTLERRFRKATGLSPLAYVQALRIDEARRRLERTSQPVEEIAVEAGYENLAFFRRVFRRETRLTPSAYRRKFQLRGLAPAAAPSSPPVRAEASRHSSHDRGRRGWPGR